MLDSSNHPIIHSYKMHLVRKELDRINFNETQIKRSTTCKFLGLTLDDKLNFIEHTDQLTKKLVKTGTAFKLIRNHLTHVDKLKIYNAYFNSRIKYGIETYGLTTERNLRKIQIQQNFRTGGSL